MKIQKAQCIFTETQDSQLTTYTYLARTKILPYQWEALNDRIEGAEPSSAIRNFRIAAGLESGEFHGFVFQDSDIGKWIEAAAWSLRHHPDPSLEANIDATVEILAKAQAQDGYLNSYFTIKEPGKRWTNLTECHELYSAGHLLEGALAYAQASGKMDFLNIMLRYVDLIDKTFGPEPGQIQGCDGHEEIELALLRLYDYLENPKHLKLAAFFLNIRGNKFFEQEWEARGHRSIWSKSEVPSPDLVYLQAHVPIKQQTKAVGHAVRACYLYSAMAELLRWHKDAEMEKACQNLWNNITQKQMYVSGAIGSTRHGEAFGFDYHLPNETAYAETCASIALIFFAQAQLEKNLETHYADVIEQILYNTVMASVDLDGSRFTYVNPQEIWPDANKNDVDRQHVKTSRQAWFGCACCPPNLARLLLSFDRYIALGKADTLYINHYTSCSILLATDEFSMKAEISSKYPQDGRVLIRMSETSTGTLALRIPAWCKTWQVRRQDEVLNLKKSQDGYLRLTGPWNKGDEIILTLGLEVELIEANPLVRANAGKVCIRRGPVLYCVEECDNGPNLSRLSIPKTSSFSVEEAHDLAIPYQAITVQALERPVLDWETDLYRPVQDNTKAFTLRAIPYSFWGNRKSGEMQIWIPFL